MSLEGVNKREISDDIRTIAGVKHSPKLVDCIVTDNVKLLSQRKVIVTSVDATLTFENLPVRYMTNTSSGFLVKPSVDSIVTVLLRQDTEPVIVCMSEIDSIQFDIQSVLNDSWTSFLFEDGLIQFNDGTYGGLVEVQPLVDKINRLEGIVEDLLNKWNAFCSVYVPSSPATPGLPASLVSSSVNGSLEPQTKREDLENKFVTHGA